MSAEACGRCRFWDVSTEAFHKGQIGDCRRHAPRIDPVLLARIQRQPTINGAEYEYEEQESDIYHASAFPMSEVSSWCGEFEPQGEAALQQTGGVASSMPRPNLESTA